MQAPKSQSRAQGWLPGPAALKALGTKVSENLWKYFLLLTLLLEKARLLDYIKH